MGGDPPAPPPQESTHEMLKAFQLAFPRILQVQNEGAVPAAQAQLAANQATAPGLAALQAQLYEAFGPRLANVSNQINAQQAKSQAESDLSVLQGPGRQLIQEANAAQRAADPEFYAAREATGTNLAKLFSSIDPTGQLSAGEQEQIRRGTAQQQQARGIATNPSQTAVVEGAMKFGGAQTARENNAKNQLTQALSVATGALPAMKSGQDAFQIGTGRSSMPNQGDNKFTGVDTSLGSAAQGLGGNLLNQVGGIVQQKNDINANRRDSLDRFNQSFSSIVGSL